jgi:hypothetical protein
MMTFEDFRAMALVLPGVEEHVSYSASPAFRVRKKFLARLRVEHDEKGILVLSNLDETEKEMLLETQPETFFITDHYRGHPTALIRLANADPAQIEDMLERSWRQLASKKQLAEFEAIREKERA